MLLARAEDEAALDAVGRAGAQPFRGLPQCELEVPQMFGDVALLNARALGDLVSRQLFGS